MTYQLYQNAFRSTNNQADSETRIRTHEPTHTNLDYIRHDHTFNEKT